MDNNKAKCPICNHLLVDYEPPGEGNPSTVKLRCRNCRKIYEIWLGEKNGKATVEFVEKKKRTTGAIRALSDREMDEINAELRKEFNDAR